MTPTSPQPRYLANESESAAKSVFCRKNRIIITLFEYRII